MHGVARSMRQQRATLVHVDRLLDLVAKALTACRSAMPARGELTQQARGELVYAALCPLRVRTSRCASSMFVPQTCGSIRSCVVRRPSTEPAPMHAPEAARRNAIRLDCTLTNSLNVLTAMYSALAQHTRPVRIAACAVLLQTLQTELKTRRPQI